MLKGKQPSRGIEFLDKIGYLDRYFIYEDENGEVHRFTELKNIDQPPDRHPEGNTWIHTLQCIDAAAEIIVLEAKNTQSIEVGETVFESVPSFVTQRQLEELVTSASFAAEKKSNEFRRELVESVLLKLDPEFKVKQQAHLKKVEEEIESEFNAYLKRVKASESWKGPKVSEKAKINARAKIKKEVEADNLPDWESQLERMFDSLVAKRLITDEDIELLEGETKKRTISFMNRRIELDRINLERDMKMAVMLTTMFHDIGKISTTEFNEERGRLTAFGHAEAGIDPTKQILKFFHNTRVSGKVKNLIPELVMFHMSPWEAVDNYQKYLEVQKYKEVVANYQKYLEVQKYKREHPGEELPPEMEDYPKSNPMSPWETTDDNQDDKKDHSDEELPEKMKNYPKSDPRRGLKKRARTLRSLGGNLMVLAMVAEADKRGRRPAEEGNHPLDRGMTSRGTVAEMYEIINFVKLAIEEEEKSQNVAVSGNQIKKTLKEVVGDISKGGAPFVGVVKKALLAAYDEGEFKNKDEGTSLILPTYERFSNYVAENSNDIASARDLWIELAKMEDPREALS